MANLERAIAAYTEATTIFRQPGLERDLASTLTNLGSAFLTQAQLGQEPVANLERAIANYREALVIVTPEVSAADCLKIGRSLGNLGFQQGWWDIALEGAPPWKPLNKAGPGQPVKSFAKRLSASPSVFMKT